jgi:hypothetical protein
VRATQVHAFVCRLAPAAVGMLVCVALDVRGWG